MLPLKQLPLRVLRALRTTWHAYVSLYRHARVYVRILTAVSTAVALFALYILAVCYNFLWLFGKSPSLHEIMHPDTNIASEIYSADSVLIGKYFNENRSPVTYEEVAPHFFQTLIDTEDERFYRHHGVDIVGIGAAFKDMLKGDARGASTLTQQLVKNMFRMRTKYSNGLLGRVPGVKLIVMKTKEWILAIGLEMFYSKKEILTMYANTVDFGSNAFGIKTAARTYFNTTPAELRIEECAVLVGLLKATSTYNPRLHPRRSRERRNVVLDNLRRHDHLSPAVCDSLKATEINLNFSVENVYDGKALYFRQELAKHLREIFSAKDLDIDLYGDGLRIYTTIDSRMQEYAEATVNRQMRVLQERFDEHWRGQEPWQNERHEVIPQFIENIARRLPVYKHLERRFDGNADSINHYLNLPHHVTVFSYDSTRTVMMSTLDSIRYMVRFLHTGFVAIEPQTRHIKAWVGDIDYGSWKHDKVTADRQPGSTFKLFVYTAALNAGMAPSTRRCDSYVALNVYDSLRQKEVLWAPHNANGYFTDDTMTLRAAFAQSVNSIAVKVGLEVGPEAIADVAHQMGIHSRLDPQPALSLGSSDVKLLELVNAYATIAAEGEAEDPIYVSRVVDRNGRVVFDESELHSRRKTVLPYRTAFLMQQMLQAGLREPDATSMALWQYIRNAPNTDFGGKTGTSNNHSDAWYVGVTPALVAGAWVGGEYRSIHFRTGALGQGSRTALPIFGYFMQSLMADPAFAHYQQKFPKPKERISESEYIFANYYHEPDTLDADSLADVLNFSLEADSIE